MTFRFTDSAFRQLSRLERNTQKRVLEKLEFYCSQEQPLQFAQRLHDSRCGEWRFRVGEYRLLCDVEEDTVLVLAVGHRKEIYR